jgi:hypothetical protein
MPEVVTNTEATKTTATMHAEATTLAMPEVATNTAAERIIQDTVDSIVVQRGQQNKHAAPTEVAKPKTTLS